MEPSPRPSNGRPVDLLVVGGGIHGLFAAYDAARRGLQVVLVERDDFGSGLSCNHQRTVHGGLRALGSARLFDVRAQRRERGTWAAIAPHLLDPLPFLVGTYRGVKRSRWMIGAGLAVYEALGPRPDRRLPDRLRLPQARLVSLDETTRTFPGIAREGLTGGAVWFDYQLRHPDRLNWLVAAAARRAGADLFNYVEAVGPSFRLDRVAGMRVRDVITGGERDIAARVTLLAAGAGLPMLLSGIADGAVPPLLRASSLLLDRRPAPMALAAPGPSGRVLTAVPWHDAVLVGTFQSEACVPPSAPGLPPGGLEAMLAETAAAFPHLEADRQAVRLVHAGLVPAIVRRGRAELLPTSLLLDETHGLPAGLHAIVGVKFTTARQSASAAVDRVMAALGRRGSCTTGTEALPGAGAIDPEVERRALPPLDARLAAHLLDWYGPEASAVAAWAASHDQLVPLAAGSPVMAGEIGYAVETAAVRRLADVVLRRTDLGAAGHPGPEALTRASALMAAALGWTDERRQQEIAIVERRFPARS